MTDYVYQVWHPHRVIQEEPVWCVFLMAASVFVVLAVLRGFWGFSFSSLKVHR